MSDLCFTICLNNVKLTPEFDRTLRRWGKCQSCSFCLDGGYTLFLCLWEVCFGQSVFRPEWIVSHWLLHSAHWIYLLADCTAFSCLLTEGNPQPNPYVSIEIMFYSVSPNTCSITAEPNLNSDFISLCNFHYTGHCCDSFCSIQQHFSGTHMKNQEPGQT